jgi:hypothetical protein
VVLKSNAWAGTTGPWRANNVRRMSPSLSPVSGNTMSSATPRA